VTELSETTRGSGGFGSTGVEQSTLQTSTAVVNGAKKVKVAESEPISTKAARVTRLLRLVDQVKQLDLEEGSEVVTKLRRSALSNPCSLEPSLVGALEIFKETEDKTTLLENLELITT
ncbi:unnamed protein product, partial [Hapterophycus canaliculatus]